MFSTGSVRGDSMSDPAYAHGKFLEAVEHLATGPDDVKRRLYDAYFKLWPAVQEDDLPPSIREDFRWVMAQLTKRGPAYDHKGKVISSDVNESLLRMHRTTGVKIAQRFLRIFWQLDDYVREHRLGQFASQKPADPRRGPRGSAKKK